MAAVPDSTEGDSDVCNFSDRLSASFLITVSSTRNSTGGKCIFKIGSNMDRYRYYNNAKQSGHTCTDACVEYV